MLKEDDRLYGIDFVHKNYYIPSYMSNKIDKYRIFDLDFFLNEYDVIHKPILFYHPIKKEVDNKILLKNLRTFKYHKFMGKTKTVIQWLLNHMNINFNTLENNETVCTAFTIQLLEKSKAINTTKNVQYPDEVTSFLRNSGYFDKHLIFGY